MATDITTTMKVVITGSNTVGATHSLSAEAYGQIDVTATGGGATTTVDVQPGAAGQVNLIFITAAEYPVAAGVAEITFEVDTPPLPAGAGPIGLDAPLLLVGSAVGNLLGPVNQIEFTNANADDIDVQILVGRDATP